ncbi:calcium-binding protein [Aestuariivirga sp.]|uniref:calcium-binding protein n=1 Tax=Aestuariivirga sp. TaxID=2650926 RepID=UPI0035935180
MAGNVVIQTAAGSDIVSFSTAILSSIKSAKFTAKIVTIIGNNGDKFTVKGTFNYADPANPSFAGFLGGTATGATLTDGAVVYATMTGFSVDAVAAVGALLGVDVNAFLATFGSIKYIGNDGADIGTGLSADDDLSGGLGDDDLKGSDGDDIIEGGAGADTLSGGRDIDTLSYKNSSAAVKVSLTGTAKGGDAAGDTFVGFENLTGSAFNDKLTGTNNVNILDGGAGNDILRGLGGADELLGGSGTDTADYTGSNAGVTVNLEADTASGGHAQGDVLESIENLTGSSFNDTLTGDNLANVLKGGAGNDVLDGGVNADKLDGGGGNDRLIGGQSVDTLFGRGGADTFVLSNLASSADKIRDFAAGVDSLEIDAALFGGGLTGGVALAAGQVEVNGTGLASTGAVRFILNSNTGELFFDVNGSGGGATGSRLIATLDGTLGGFSSSDFDIV